jgi:Permease family
MEGIAGLLAGIWGTGFGSSTLTENVHTIAVTKMGSRRAVEFGAILLILVSLIGKILVFSEPLISFLILYHLISLINNQYFSILLIIECTTTFLLLCQVK